MSSLCAEPLEDAWLVDGFCAEEVPVSVGAIRSIISIGTTEFLAVDRGVFPQEVIRLVDLDGDGIAETKETLVQQEGLNHGLALLGGYLYASRATTVFRWPYQPGDDSVGTRETVINNMSADGNGGAPQGHQTRTLIFDSMGLLYVAVGSNQNVDANSFRSRIRRFDLSSESLPISFVTGEVFADGLRNTVGMAFDKFGVLWGVENGADRLEREDLGGFITNDNPAEELNRFPEEDAGKNWGYPECWSEFMLADGVGGGPGTRWAWPDFMDAGITDEYCRTETQKSQLSMQAHSAPLGITFYEYKEDTPDGCFGAFPKEMDGYAFVAHHGSWNREVPTGYKVVFIPMDGNGQVPDGEVARDLLRHDGSGAKWPDGFRPVDVGFDDCGRLLVSSDGTRNVGGGKIVRIAYQNENAASGPPSTPFPSSLGPTEAPVMSSSSGTGFDPIILSLFLVLVTLFLGRRF